MGTGHYYFDEVRSSKSSTFTKQMFKISVTAAAAAQKKGI
jgi:hypothetical protein